MLRAAVKKSSNFITQARSYKTNFVHFSVDSENRTTELLSSLLRANNNYKWKHIASMPHIFVKLTPGVIRSVFKESHDVDASRLLHFFDWCEDELGIQHDLSSFSVVAVALCNAENYSYCRLFIKRMVAICGTPLIVVGSLVKFYREIEGSKGNVFDILADVYRENARLVDAINVFLASNVVGHQPGMDFINLLLIDLLEANMIDEFWKVCDGMDGAVVMLDTCNLIKTHLDCRDVHLAKNVLYELEGDGCDELSVGTFNSVIVALCETGELHEAVKLGKAMMVKGLYPDVHTFNTLIHGFQRNNKKGDVASFLSDIKGMGWKPDAVTYNDLMDGLFNQDEFTQALKVWYEIHASGVQMNAALYHTIVSGVCKAGQINRVAEIVSQMIVRGIQPDFYTRYILLRGSLAKKDVGKAIERTLSQYGLQFNKLSSHSSLVGILR